MNTEARIARAEEILYDWACERIKTQAAKAKLARIGFDVDFRQPDRGNWIEARDLSTGHYVDLTV